MKRLLFLILLLPCIVYGQTVGIKVASPIIKNSPSDNTITGYANLLNGGYHTVGSLSGRDSLVTSYSKTLNTGMLVYVNDVDSTYRWSGTDWTPVLSGGITPEILSDSLQNYTPLQDGLISGGSATIGTGSVTIDTAYYRINRENKISLPRTFTGIANSASGTQYYILVYGKSDNTLDTLQGVQDTIATIPTKPNGTVNINTVLVGDGGVENTVPDLTGYAKLTGGNNFYGRQTFYDHATKFNSIYGIPQVFVDMLINGIYRGGFGSFNDRFRIAGADDSGVNTFPYVELFRATKHAHFFGTVEGLDPVNSQDFVTKAWGLANLGGGGTPDTAVYRTVANSRSLAQGQDKLVSGTNIKTVNSTSLLGSSDISLEVPLTFGYGLTRASNTVTADTTSGTGLVSKTRLTGALTSKANIPTSQILTDGGTITWDINSGGIATVTLGGNRTLAITNAVANRFYQITLTQDGTGSRTITLPAGSKVINSGSGAVTLTTTTGAKDILSVFYDGTNYYWNIGLNYN